MRRIILFSIICLLLTACGKESSKSVIDKFHEKLENDSYYIKGNLSVLNQDEVYHYDVEVSYQKGFYKVILINTANNHEQIILKNKDGVYVLTPALNKSFRFQSEWPYNHSQVYLLDCLLDDLKRDHNVEFSEKNNDYILKTNVNYPNNRRLFYQKIIFSKSITPKKVSVYDKDGIEYLTMNFDKVKYKPNFSKDEFLLDTVSNKSDTAITGSFEDIIYPLFLPEGTKLESEEMVPKESGNRVLMNYDGEKSFLLVEESMDVFDEFTVIPTLGEPYLLMDTIGVMTDNSLSWTSNGVDFYLVSDVMSQDELVEVAQSIVGIVSMK